MFGDYEGQRTRFLQCHKVPFEISLSDQRVFETPGKQIENILGIVKNRQDGEEDMTGACTWMDLKARSPGFSRTKISYHFPSLAGGGNHNLVRLSNEITLAAYKPLAPVQPASGETLLSVESSLQIVWAGGPLPWINKPEYHFFK